MEVRSDMMGFCFADSFDLHVASSRVGLMYHLCFFCRIYYA